MMGEKQLDPTVIKASDEQTTMDYLRAEVAKLSNELRERTAENQALKETIVRMAMKQNDVKEKWS